MNEIVEFLPEHLIAIDPIYPFQNNEAAIHTGKILKEGGPSASLFHDGVLAICAGIRILWKGNGESWMFLSKSNHGPSVLRELRNYLNELIEKEGLDRVTAIIPIGDKWARTERFLGFSLETYLRKFGPNGVDKVLYSRIR
jgi:hypothetical protein